MEAANIDIDQLSQLDPPTLVDLSSLRSGHEGRDTDIFIAVMGVTGAGKSTLISKLTNGPVKPKIGNSLRSCTTEVEVFQFVYSSTVNVYLIDTPGFDDTDLADSDTLRTLATRLALMHSINIPLHGILYLHRISDTRMNGSAMKNLRVFKKLCGPGALKKVILVTTMWENVLEDTGAAREEELRTTKDFWKPMIQKGSRIERYQNDIDSAVRLVDILIQASRSAGVVETPLQIQREMVNGEKELKGTEAAQEIMTPVKERTNRNTKELEEVRREAREVPPGDEEDQAQQQETIQDLEIQIQKDLDLQEQLEKKFATTADELIQREDNQSNIEADNVKKKRIEEQYESRHSIEPPPKRQDLHLSRHQSWSENYSQRADISDPWWVRGTKVFSISLNGRHCSFLGPAHSKSYLPQSTRNNLVSLERSNNFRIKRVVLGEKKSYFVHFHQGSMFRKCYYSGAVQKVYPDLFDFLRNNENTACPSLVSLGPEGSYFINVDGRKSLKCHPQSPIDDEAQNASRLWWGANGSYVLELNDEAKTVKMDLKGQYGVLGETLEESNEGIKELALNIADGSSFALILNNGSVFHGGLDEIVSGSFKEYADMHFREQGR